MKDFDFKKALPYAGVLLFFIAISLGYFYPQLQGKQLATHDQKQWKGGAQELNEKYQDGEIRLWTNAMFGGMPAYYVSMHYSTNIISKYVRPLTKMGIERPAIYIIWSLVSFFILMMVLKVDIPIGVMGAVGYAFSSYNFVVLAAGHFAKVLALGYLPGILAGAILIRQKKYITGLMVTALFMSFEMISNHPQMTYYFFVFFIAVYFLLQFFEDLKAKDFRGYIVSASLFGGAILLGILPSMAQLMTTQEYTKYSTRGKSELTKANDGEKTTGLDRSYITNWSNGIAETWSLLIPHAKGPGSSTIATHKTAMKAVEKQFKKPMEGVDAYWGDQPFIGGPMYAGAIIVFLCVLGFFIVDGVLKWTVVISIVVTTMLSWGKNFEALTNFFIDYFPMYNKFRAVVSIEIVALFAIPLMAALALKKLIENKEILSESLVIFGKPTKITGEKALIAAFALTGGLSLLFWMTPTTFFDFFKTGEYDNYVNSLKQNGWPVGQISDLLANIEAARIALFKADAIRTFAFILGAAGLLWAYGKNKMQAGTVTALIALLVLVDMWGVNTRYMDVEKGFTNKKNVAQPFQKSVADQQILADQSPDKRVLNVSTSTFNETGTSYFHHSIGGYNGAKMKNYQEVIERHLSGEIAYFMNGLKTAKSAQDIYPIFDQTPVLNMLNTKYVIYNPGAAPIQNPQAQGGAWFVSNIQFVPSADEEIAALSSTNLRQTAIIREDQKANIAPVGNGIGQIKLVEYDLDRLVYETNSATDQVAVLSEIWYPVGWSATIDNEPIDISRANYILRTINVPAGAHTIEFRFEPTSYYTGEKIALAGSILLLLLIAGSIYMAIKPKTPSVDE